MHPRRFPEERASSPRFEAERRVWDALRTQLGDDVHIFHSVAFLDQTLGGTTRDAEADFIIADPGNGVLCLEVKGGAVTYDPESGQFTSTDRTGTQHAIRSPKEQAKRAKYHLLQSIPRAMAAWGNPPWVLVCTAVCFPDAYREGDEFPDIDPRETIYFDDLDRLDTVIPAIFAFHRGGKAKRPYGASLIKACEQILEPPERVGSPTTVRLTKSESELFELTADQMRVLNGLRFAQRFAVAGGPGTGKTVIAFEQAKWLASQGYKTLLTCFNRLLADRLAANAVHLSNLKVCTFHQLASEAFSNTQFDEEGNILAIGNPLQRYEAIVVDEAQNFQADWWIAIESLLTNENARLNVFYDPNQEIYDGTNAFPSVFGDPHGNIMPPGWSGFLLTDNVRNTSPIIAAANRLCPQYVLPDNGVEGEEVLVIPCDDSNIVKETAKETQRLIESGVPPREIAVLCAWSSEKVDKFLDKIRPHLKAPVSRKAGDNVLVETVRRFQGLDASVVILVGLDAIGHNAGATLVAVTRARSRLTVIASPTICHRLGIQERSELLIEFRETSE